MAMYDSRALYCKLELGFSFRLSLSLRTLVTRLVGDDVEGKLMPSVGGLLDVVKPQLYELEYLILL